MSTTPLHDDRQGTPVDTQIVLVYCLCDDLLKAFRHWADPRCRASDAEIPTTAPVAALHFGGPFRRAHGFLHEGGYLPRRLGASRFTRRVHRCAPFAPSPFRGLAGLGHRLDPESVRTIDRFPPAVCDNTRIPRCRRYRGEAWRGYQASKRRYFHGPKIHPPVTAHGQPVEFFLTPGADSDTKALEQHAFELPESATVAGDEACNGCAHEDPLQDIGLHRVPPRKQNPKRPLEPAVTRSMATAREAAETTGRSIERLLPKHIHTVTAAAFELKAALFVLARGLNFVF